MAQLGVGLGQVDCGLDHLLRGRFLPNWGVSSDETLALPNAQTQHFNNNIPGVILEIDGGAFS